MKDKTSATGVMVAHLAYIQLVEVRFFGRRPPPFIIVFTSCYWCRWYDQYKNSPPLFSRRLRLMVRTPPFHGGNVAFKSHRRHHHPLFFLLSYQRRPVWLTNPTGLIWCFLLRVGNRPLKTEMRGSIPASITTFIKLVAYIL